MNILSGITQVWNPWMSLPLASTRYPSFYLFRLILMETRRVLIHGISMGPLEKQWREGGGREWILKIYIRYFVKYNIDFYSNNYLLSSIRSLKGLIVMNDIGCGFYHCYLYLLLNIQIFYYL